MRPCASAVLVLWIGFAAAALPLAAEEGVLVLQVVDFHAQPVAGVVVGTAGDGATGPPTTREGKTRLRLPPAVKPGETVTLQLVKDNAAGTKWVFLSPWDRRATVPSFENKPDAYSSIVLGRRADRDMLQSGQALQALTKNLLDALPTPMSGEKVTEEGRRKILAERAEEFGLAPEEVDLAIRAWREKTENPLEKGLSLLYSQQFSEAAVALQSSLDKQEKAFAKEVAKRKKELAENAYYLGVALDQAGKVEEATDAYAKAASYDPENANILSSWGVGLVNLNRLGEAEKPLRELVTLQERELGADDLRTLLSNLYFCAVLLQDNKPAEAWPLLERAAATAHKIYEGESNFLTVMLHTMLAQASAKQQDPATRSLYDRVIAESRQVYGDEHPMTFQLKQELAQFLSDQNDPM